MYEVSTTCQMANEEESFQLFTSLRHDSLLLAVPHSAFEAAGWNFQRASPLYMLDYHRDRLLKAANHWGWDLGAAAIRGDAGLSRLADFVLNTLSGKGDGPHRVKVTLAKDGRLGCEVSVVPTTDVANLFPVQLPPPGSIGADAGSPVPRKEPLYAVIVDIGSTARSEHTHFKTTRRAMYDSARQRAGIQLPDRKEVLVVHEEDGLVMEGSTTTPYFCRGGRWVTPPVSLTYSPEAGSGGQDGTTRRWALERRVPLPPI